MISWILSDPYGRVPVTGTEACDCNEKCPAEAVELDFVRAGRPDKLKLALGELLYTLPSPTEEGLGSP